MKINTLILSDSARQDLEFGYRKSSKHSFRTRCFIVLLKADGRTTEDICNLVKKHRNSVNSTFVVDFLDNFVETIQKKTFIVLDNATMHKSKLMQAQMEKWQEKGLFIFFLPPYPPKFNITETLWRILKTL